jgi:hypothetical protein
MKIKIVFGLTALAALASAAPMQFTRADSYIVAQGEITEATPAAFARLSVTPGTALYFDSPGGVLGAGLELGRLIRRAGLNTYVAPQGNGCYSACVYAFAGGWVRTYDGRAPLGVHQFRGGRDTASSAQTALARIAGYLDEMGVDHRLLEAASLVPPERISALPVQVAREWRLDNSQAASNVAEQSLEAARRMQAERDSAMTAASQDSQAAQIQADAQVRAAQIQAQAIIEAARAQADALNRQTQMQNQILEMRLELMRRKQISEAFFRLAEMVRQMGIH